MKRMICLVLLVVVAVTTLAACGKFTCDMCGEEKSGKKYTREMLGVEIEICKDCQKELEEFADTQK